MTTLAQAAAALWRDLRGTGLHPEAVSYLQNDTSGNWGLACSGGADSVCMVLLVWSAFPQAHSRMRLLHFNHGIRGADADADAAAVDAIGTELGLKVTSERAVIKTDPSALSEAHLRAARMDFFARAECNTILTGHQLNDVAESLLMRLTRGSGLEGLAAPRPVSSAGYAFKLVRPLLNFNRIQIQTALRKCGIDWHEDTSNATGHYFRNRVRSTLIPQIETVSKRDFFQACARTRMLLQEDAEALEAIAKSLWAQLFNGECLNIIPLKSAARAVVRRLLHQFINTLTPDTQLQPEALQQLIERIISGQPFRQSLGEHFLVSQSGYLILSQEPPPSNWQAFSAVPGRSYRLCKNTEIRLETLILDAGLKKKILSGNIHPQHEAFIAFDQQPPPSITIRPWLPGDTLQMLGAPGRRKLQDIFVDKKIDASERKRLPIVCFSSQTIVWCPGIPPADTCKITPHTYQALRLTYTTSL